MSVLEVDFLPAHLTPVPLPARSVAKCLSFIFIRAGDGLDTKTRKLKETK